MNKSKGDNRKIKKGYKFSHKVIYKIYKIDFVFIDLTMKRFQTNKKIKKSKIKSKSKLRNLTMTRTFSDMSFELDMVI